MNRLKRRWSSGVIVALILCLSLVSCGDDDAGTSSDTTTTTAAGTGSTTSTTEAPAEGSDLEQAIDELYQVALDEGEDEVIVAYVPLQSYMLEWKPLFEERFPGITLTPRDFGNNPAWGSLVLQELNAGTRSVDTGITSSLVYKPLFDAGMLEEVDWSEFGVPEDRLQPPIPGLLIHHDIACGISIYDTRDVSADEVPDDPTGWLDPRWKDQMAMEPFNGLACMAWYAMKVGEQEALALATAMKEDNGLLVVDSAENLVASGERSVIPFHATRGLDLRSKGIPVEGKFLEGSGGIARQGFSVVADTPSPNATRLFILWSISDEAQDLSEQTLGGAYSFVGPSRPDSPLRAEIERQGLDPDDPEFFTYENPDNWAMRADLATRLREALVG